MSKVAPRKAFLDFNFEKPWSIERFEPPNQISNHYELRYFGSGPRDLMWQVEVFTRFKEIVRVEMLYTAPPPF